jgi:mannose-6-phosphate isomerase
MDPLQLIPEYRPYVWGGDRLRPGQSPTAEAWVIYENDEVASGPLAGRTLGQVAADYGPALLGKRVFKKTGTRFPLLIKLLDCAQWLSLQVHPNDKQARRLEGPEFVGKTEAWHVLEAVQGAQLIAGLKPGTSGDELTRAIRNGTILEFAQYLDVHPGDTIFMPPGTIHALGPGLLIYEVQQTSDLTYRVWDWDRPQTGGRVLHIEKSLEVANPKAATKAVPAPALRDGEHKILTRNPYFTLELLAARTKPAELDTHGDTFNAITVIEGAATLEACSGSGLTLERFQSAVVPAECGKYSLNPQGNFRALKASV